MTTPEKPTHPVLAIIDMQVAFSEAGSDWLIPRYAEVENNVAKLAHAFEDKVLWTKFVRAPEEEGAWSEYYDRWSSFRVDEDSRQWDLTLLPAANHTVISRPTFSKWGPELAELAPLGTPLVICGVATDCCVLATALAAIDDGRSVIVCTDACGAVNDLAQEQTLSVLSLLAPMVRLTTTDEVLQILEPSAAS
ncbi:cysteine hydrolase [Corynebacterium ammoniagenes]|uniref:cysteine hydrolase family protein n=1 Tax=Corynebacterium ammoniagenes TaxID=1697 RepID=UPI0014599967|nr:cysteine hydrolase [Corynebacterium ammoniagenes]NMF31816.1 cysteine hydrolase [Corynebacterium ammoniagenes]